MRMIDADSFKEKLLRRKHIGCGEYYSGMEAERDSIVDELDDEPTVNVGRCGRWVCGYDEQDEWTCSECKKGVLPADWFVTPMEEGYQYCPYCGTKMEG